MAIGIAIACAACRSRDARKDVASDDGPPGTPVLVGTASTSLDNAPPSRHAAFRAPPREAWACALDIEEHQGFSAQGRATFVYGKRDRCLLPYDVVMLGIFGCPESIERLDTDGTRSSKQAKYDDAGRLVELDTNGGSHNTYTWDGDRLDTVARKQWGQTDHARYVDDGADVAAVDDKGRLQLRLGFTGEHVVRGRELLYGMSGGEAAITWEGNRPTVVTVTAAAPVRGSVSRRFVYDCPPTPSASARPAGSARPRR